MKKYIPISVDQQCRIVADMAAYKAAWLKMKGGAEEEILKIENQQPLMMRDYFRQRYNDWLSLYSEPLYFLDE